MTTNSTVPMSGAPVSSTSRPLSAWSRWWFTPEAPLNLGICRALFFGAQFIYHLSTRFPDWASVPPSLNRPVWIFEKLHLPVLSTTGLLIFEVAWKVSLLLACFGLFTRVATAVAAIGALYLLGLPFNFGKVYHLASIIIFTSSILAFSRCGDAFSIDALIRRKRGLPHPPPSGEYRWPVRMVWVLMSVLFFNAGMAKAIRGPIFDWIFSENMAILMTQRHYMNQNALPALNWGLFIAKHPILYMTFAASSILGEVFCFLALFIRYPYRLALPLMLLSMQIGIGLLMRVWFTPYMVVYLFWIPWGNIVRRFSSGKPSN